MEPEEHTTHSAGIILIWPYISLLFDRMELTENGEFPDAKAQARAVRVLHFIATREDQPEEETLILEKVLCGLPLATPTEAPEFRKEDLMLIESLYEGVIQNWSTMQGTSADAFQQTFLQRQGQVLQNGEQFRLRVEQGPFDMLLDTLPWNLSQVNLRWMPAPLFVEWR